MFFVSPRRDKTADENKKILERNCLRREDMMSVLQKDYSGKRIGVLSPCARLRVVAAIASNMVLLSSLTFNLSFRQGKVDSRAERRWIVNVLLKYMASNCDGIVMTILMNRSLTTAEM